MADIYLLCGSRAVQSCPQSPATLGRCFKSFRGLFQCTPDGIKSLKLSDQLAWLSSFARTPGAHFYKHGRSRFPAYRELPQDLQGCIFASEESPCIPAWRHRTWRIPGALGLHAGNHMTPGLMWRHGLVWIPMGVGVAGARKSPAPYASML